MTDKNDRMGRAGDYVLGLMDEAERLRAERDLETDAAFRDAVGRLAMRMSSLDRTAEPEPLPESVWETIETRIAGLPQMQGAGVAQVRQEARIVDAGRRLQARNLSRTPSLWRGLAMAASLLAALGLGYLGGRITAPAAEPLVVVVLADEANVPGAIVEAYGDDRVRIVPLKAFDVPPGKVLQAWTLYDRAVGPISLGTFQRATEIRLTQPERLPAPVAEQLYEITLEDAPGSTAGRPLGPILVKGLAKRPAA